MVERLAVVGLLAFGWSAAAHAQEGEEGTVAPAAPVAVVESGEDEGGPVPSVEPQVVPVAAFAEPIGVPIEGVEEEGHHRHHHAEPDEDEGEEEDDDCDCEGGVVSPVAGEGEIPEGATPCECSGWMSAGPEDAPVLEIRHEPFSLAARGLLQMIGVPWQGDGATLATGGPANEPGFRFRRVRLGVEGALPFHFSYEITGEFDGSGARLLDASLAFRIPYLDVVAGAAKVPFSGSMLTPAEFLTFLDRPWAVDGETGDGTRYGIAPGRMVGVQVGTGIRVVRLRAGVYNGNDDYFVGNDNSGLLYVARVECLPLGDMPDGQLIVADGDPRVLIGGAYSFTDDAAGNWLAAEGDLRVRWLGLTIEGEFLWSRFMPDSTPEMPPTEVAQTDRWGYYAQAGYLVLPDLLEIAARYDAFLLDDGVDDLNDRWSVGGVATLFLLRNRVKLQVEYMHQQESADPQVENDFVAMQLQGRF